MHIEDASAEETKEIEIEKLTPEDLEIVRTKTITINDFNQKNRNIQLR